MKKSLITFVVIVFLLNVNCKFERNVAEAKTDIPEQKSIPITKPQTPEQSNINATPTPTPESRVALTVINPNESMLSHNDNPKLGGHYKPFWIEDEEKSDNGFEPFCMNQKINGKIIRKCGYQDAKGNILIKPVFNMVFVFSEGLAGVCPKQEGLCGYINEKGKLVIKWYQFVDVFSEGLAAVTVGDVDFYKNGYIDKQGKYVIPPQYSDASAFKNGVAKVVVQRSLKKCINTKNEEVKCVD